MKRVCQQNSVLRSFGFKIKTEKNGRIRPFLMYSVKIIKLFFKNKVSARNMVLFDEHYPKKGYLKSHIYATQPEH